MGIYATLNKLLQTVLTHAERMERRIEIVEEVLHTTRGDMLMLRQWLRRFSSR